MPPLVAALQWRFQLFVIVDFCVSNARVVIDHSVDKAVPHFDIALHAAWFARGGGTVTCTVYCSYEAPFATIEDISELRHVNVHHVVSSGVFVAPDHFASSSVGVRQTVEFAPGQYTASRRRSNRA